MKNSDSVEVVQWSYDFIQSFYLNNNESITDMERMYQNYISPFGDKYYSSLNPFLLYGGADTSKLMKKDFWMIRDGLIPLSFFFQNASLTLMENKRKFLIHKDFWFLVPPEWQKNVLFFDKKAEKTYGKGIVPKKLFLTGIANNTLATPEEFVSELEYLSKIFTKKELESMEVSAYFPNKRNDLWGRWQDENIFQYAKFLFQKIKLDIEFPEWDSIKSNMDYQNTMCYEMNSGSIIRDTYMQEMFLSRGAGLIVPEEDSFDSGFKIIKTHKLSLYHSINIYEFDYAAKKPYASPLDGELMPYYKKVLERGTNVNHFSQRWEQWYGTFVKKHYSGQS